MEKQGAPAHPGSAVWLAYLSDKPIFGVAACGMFSRATVLDLILPRLFTGARVTADDFNRLGHGGRLSQNMALSFPAYGAFRTPHQQPIPPLSPPERGPPLGCTTNPF